MFGSRQPPVTKPTGMSLAEFTKDLTSRNSHGRPACVAGTREGVGPVGQKSFAADVVGAMSNPALEPDVEGVELPERQIATAKSKGGL